MTIEGFVILYGLAVVIIAIGELLGWLSKQIVYWIWGPYPYTFKESGIKYDITDGGGIKIDIKSLVASKNFKRQMDACERIRKRQKVKVRLFTPGE